MSVFTTSGERLHVIGQSIILDYVGGRRETVFLDFGLVDGVGFFESAGLSSADFLSGPTLTLEPGAEVAQVNWDGAATYVQWTTVESVTTQDGAPILVLSNGLRPGASGGGVFWNGYHVANNWTLVETVDENGRARREQSTAALNNGALTLQLSNDKRLPTALAGAGRITQLTSVTGAAHLPDR